MRVIIQTKTLALTKAMKSFVEKQAQKMSKVAGRVSGVRVYLEQVRRKDNDPRRALARFKVDLPGKTVIVKARAVDLYQAVSEASSDIVRQVRKFREKRVTKQRKGWKRRDE